MSKIIECERMIDRSRKFTEFFEPYKALREIRFLVLHHIEANSLNHAIEQLVSHGVSSHFIIDETGNIFELVDENDVAYHAGVSYWNGCEGLNKHSIGVEFINSDAFGKDFEKLQLEAGVSLCKYIAAKYDIKPENIVGHSDIAYDKETGFLDRKQDPSHLFDWKFFADNGISQYDGVLDNILAGVKLDELQLGVKSDAIQSIKQKLSSFGYKILNLDDKYDLELQHILSVFNRRFASRNNGNA